MRGEHGAHVVILKPCAGSSPRARGTQRRSPLLAQRHRFIPACAGNTSSPIAPGRFPTVHPRVRGEHAGVVVQTAGATGSSPRARGTLIGNIAPAALIRFIPACAGNTSPAARQRVLRRFIPACAGNTPGPKRTGRARAVHPRVRGEHILLLLWLAKYGGSSPRARGTPDRHQPDLVRRRFIPACAGNTWILAGQFARNPVHPRVRGEHDLEAGEPAPDTGSSPRARGTRTARLGPASCSRFIPACAGNTCGLAFTAHG